MRYLKKLLNAVYIYLGVFLAACFVAWCITGNEPAALIAGACSATGIESIVGGIIKLREIQKERRDNAAENYKRGE